MPVHHVQDGRTGLNVDGQFKWLLNFTLEVDRVVKGGEESAGGLLVIVRHCHDDVER